MAGLPAVLTRLSWRWSWRAMGDVRAGHRRRRRGAADRPDRRPSLQRGLGRVGLGYAHLRHGDFAAATRVLEQGLALCRAMEIRCRAAVRRGVPGLRLSRVWARGGRGAVAGGGVEVITAMRILGLRSWFITFLAEAYLVLGRIAEAREQAEQAVALARAQQAAGLGSLGPETARRRPRPGAR